MILVSFPFNSFCQTLNWDFGRNDYEIPLENVDRHFIIHVPQTYTGNEPVPIVFMFHGTNAQGHSFWLDSKWKELAEVENFIAIFPSSWKYVITDEGTKDKWNFSHLYEIVQNPNQLKDDVTFINIILDLTIETFNIDASRVYASGFSNGSKFVHTRILPEMNGRFAAVGCNAGLMMNKFDIEGSLLPTTTMIGTKDGKLLPSHPDTILPFNIQEILEDPILGKVIDSTLYSLQLEKDYTVDSTQQAITFKFNNSKTGNDNEWNFFVLNRVAHVYPHGNNNPWNMIMAPIFWNYFKQFQIISNTNEENMTQDFSCMESINVFNNHLDVSCLIDDSSNNWQLYIYEINGQLIKHLYINERTLDLNDLDSGIFITNFIDENGSNFSRTFYLH